MDFYKRVELVCKQVPYGKVATYGQIALLCGKPKNSRQVGYALNKRVSGEDIPAHRIVNSKGFLSGSGAFEHVDLQKMLLRDEGVEVSRESKVDLNKYMWANTLEDALDYQKIFKENNF